MAAKAGDADALYIYDLESEEFERYKFGLDGIFSTAWSPRGNEIAFIGNKEGASDIYIFDIDNYTIDVVELIVNLKKHSSTREIPIILLSSQSDIKTLKRAIQAGCTEFVTKPFSDDLLIQKVHKLTKKEYSNIGLPKLTSEGEEDITTSFRWNKEYEIGIDAIDREHKLIIDNYEKLYHYMKLGTGHNYYHELILFLEKYVNEHFKNEQEFQQLIGYNLYEEHVLYHREFEAKIKEIITKHQNQKVSNLDLIRINLFLKDWLLQHNLVEDAKIGEFLRNKGKLG